MSASQSSKASETFSRLLSETRSATGRELARVGAPLAMQLVHPPVGDPGASTAQEDALQIAARLQAILSRDEQTVVVVTGWDESDRAGELSVQVAGALAQIAQQPVLIVDGNLRAPSLHRLFAAPFEPGFAELMDSTCRMEAAIRPTFAQSLYFLPTGNAAAGLSAPGCAQALLDLRKHFRYIVICAGPLLKTPESVLFTSISDGAVLALTAGLRRRPEIAALQSALKTLNTKLLGAVLSGGGK